MKHPHVSLCRKQTFLPRCILPQEQLLEKVYFSTDNEEHISGGTTSEPDLTFSPLQYTDFGRYRCQLSNPVGPGTSEEIILDVLCKS